jgi:hypothetical protein
MVKWEPTKFDGSDLLPIEQESQLPSTDVLPVVGDENVNPEDMVLPSIKLLQGMSKEVAEGTVEGAQPGKFFNTGTGEVIVGPLRVLVVHHSRSNAMFPKEGDPRYADLEKCISRDGIEGDTYGDCDECGRNKFGKDQKKPLCSASHNFIVMTNDGPARIRFSSRGYSSAKTFLTQKITQRKNFFAHPLMISVVRRQDDLPGGQKVTSYYLEARWDRSEPVPIETQTKALALYEEIKKAHGDGRLKTTGDDEEDFDKVPFD